MKHENMTSEKLSRSENNTTNNLHRQEPKKNTENSVHKKLTSPKIAYSIVHVMSGRVRFRIPRLGRDSDYANKLQQLIESDSRITNVRINPLAASIVISYQTGMISDEKMRSHFVYLIQNAPNIALPAKKTTKTFIGAIFDALINLIDSTRNINQARHANTYGNPRTDVWERVLKSAKTCMKGIKSATMFFIPNKRWPSQTSDRKVSLQPSPL